MRAILLSTCLTLLVVACAPTSQTPNISNELAEGEAAIQRELAVKENFKYSTRLANVSAPILMANVEMCEGMVAPYIGAELGTYDAYPKDYRDTMAKLYGVGSHPTVTMTPKKTPAARSLRVGDMITHVNGEALPEGKNGLKAFQTRLLKNENADPMSLTIDRGGKTQTVKVNPVHACNSPVLMSSSDAVNAFANGKVIGVTKGMMRFVENDTELATVVGHELAHNTRTHVRSKQGNAILGMILGGVITAATGINMVDLGGQIGAGVNSQAFEEEADYVGLYHTARAGYNISSAPNLWRRMAASNPAAIHLAGSTHPSSAKRFLALEATVKEINKKRARGEKLIPEERVVRNETPEKERAAGGNG